MTDENGSLIQRPDLSIADQPESYIGSNVFDPRLGTAAMQPTRDLVKYHRYSIGSFFLGRSIEDDLSVDGAKGEVCAAPVGHKGEGHILICAETRAGKSERILVGNLGLWPGSALVVDCKGMLATMTAERRGQGNPEYCEGMGQDVYVIDPKRTAQVPDEMRASINPIDWLSADDSECIGKSRILAEALIPDDDGKSSDPYWPTEGRELLAVMMTHVATSTFIAEENRNLHTVYRLITSGDVDIIADLLSAGALNDSQVDSLSPFDAMFRHMVKNPVFNDYVSIYATGVGELFENARKQWEGVRSQATQSLGWLADPEMLASMRESQVRLSDLKSKPHGVSVYLSIPSMQTNWRWVRLMVKMFTEETRSMKRPATGHQTLVVLDEFTSMKYMPEMDELMDKSAEYGIRMCIVIQRMEQIKRVYPKSWGQFFSAADVRWFFGMECQVTREYIEKELGEVEVMRITRNRSVAKGTTEQETTGSSDTTNTNRTTGTSKTKSKGTQSGSGDGHSTGKSRNHKETAFGEITGFAGVAGLFENGFLMAGDSSRNGGRNWNYNRSKNKSSSSTTNESQNEGESHTDQISRSTGTSSTDTFGYAENVHKRPIIAASELPSYLAKVEDPNDPRFPGMALVIIRGGVRTMVRTVKYYDDQLFHRAYGKHPLYLFNQAPSPWPQIAAEDYQEKRRQRLEAERLAEEERQAEAARQAARKREVEARILSDLPGLYEDRDAQIAHFFAAPINIQIDMTKLFNEAKCRGGRYDWSVHCISDHRYQKGHPWVSGVITRGDTKKELEIAWSGYNCKANDVRVHHTLPLVEIYLKPDKKTLDAACKKYPFEDDQLEDLYRKYQWRCEEDESSPDFDKRRESFFGIRSHIMTLESALRKECYPNPDHREMLDETFPMRFYHRFKRRLFPSIDLYGE